MRRILIPLDGSDMATRVLEDARRLAGPEGELILVADVNQPAGVSDSWFHRDGNAIDAAETYLESWANRLRAEGVRVQTHVLVLNDIPLSIDEAARLYDADMIVCATHGRSPLGRLVHGGVAWRAMAHSTVPVVLHHMEDTDTEQPPRMTPRRILVPLDGSERAAGAVPLAAQLAQEWSVPLYLVTVVPVLPPPSSPRGRVGGSAGLDYSNEVAKAHADLDAVAAQLAVETHTRVFVGSVVDTLAQAVADWDISDIVMASHGRTGLMRVILGSVADMLIRRLHIPVVVLPSRAHVASQVEPAGSQPRDTVPV